MAGASQTPNSMNSGLVRSSSQQGVNRPKLSISGSGRGSPTSTYSPPGHPTSSPSSPSPSSPSPSSHPPPSTGVSPSSPRERGFTTASPSSPRGPNAIASLSPRKRNTLETDTPQTGAAPLLNPSTLKRQTIDTYTSPPPSNSVSTPVVSATSNLAPPNAGPRRLSNFDSTGVVVDEAMFDFATTVSQESNSSQPPVVTPFLTSLSNEVKPRSTLSSESSSNVFVSSLKEVSVPVPNEGVGGMESTYSSSIPTNPNGGVGVGDVSGRSLARMPSSGAGPSASSPRTGGGIVSPRMNSFSRPAGTPNTPGGSAPGVNNTPAPGMRRPTNTALPPPPAAVSPSAASTTSSPSSVASPRRTTNPLPGPPPSNLPFAYPAGFQPPPPPKKNPNPSSIPASLQNTFTPNPTPTPTFGDATVVTAQGDVPTADLSQSPFGDEDNQ